MGTDKRRDIDHLTELPTLSINCINHVLAGMKGRPVIISSVVSYKDQGSNPALSRKSQPLL